MLDSERSDGVYRNKKKTHVVGLALARPSARSAHGGAWLHAGWCISDLSTLCTPFKNN